MATVLHLLKGDDPALALAAIDRQLGAGDRVEVVLLHGANAPTLPPEVPVRRVPDDLPWEALLERLFAVDHVITW